MAMARMNGDIFIRGSTANGVNIAYIIIIIKEKNGDSFIMMTDLVKNHFWIRLNT